MRRDGRKRGGLLESDDQQGSSAATPPDDGGSPSDLLCVLSLGAGSPDPSTITLGLDLSQSRRSFYARGPMVCTLGDGKVEQDGEQTSGAKARGVGGKRDPRRHHLGLLTRDSGHGNGAHLVEGKVV